MTRSAGRPAAIGTVLLLAGLIGLVGPPATAGDRAGSDPPPTPAADPAEVSGLDGVASAPTRDVAKVKAAQRRASAGAATVSGFATSGVRIRPVPPGQLPYQSSRVLPLKGEGLTDDQGVRVFRFAGDTRVWQHPVGQAQYSMWNLDSHRLTGNQVYLDRAIANAQRLIDRRVESGGGWYYPYDFDFAVLGDTTQTLKAPWYSGMAQGQALSAFVRLYETTHQQRWKDAADATFQSLRLAPVQDQPWGAWVDADKHLWLEEYPRWPVTDSERVLNGHVYAAFGLYDYARLTGDADALAMYDGALTTVDRTLMSMYRQPRWASLYSLQHHRPTTSYHQKHVAQLLWLQRETGRSAYALWAGVLRADFPDRTTAGTLMLTPRSKVAYKLDGGRKIVAKRTVAFTRNTSAPADRRERSYGGPVMLRASAGAYAGWWFPEAAGTSWLRGPKDVHAYAPTLKGVFSPGSFVAYRYDTSGRLVSRRTVRITRSSSAPVTQSAVADGRVASDFPAGAFAGYWVPAQPALAVS